jgi:Holliday junction resolvasome RuvABC ATP-dependent DNA helicase subunit
MNENLDLQQAVIEEFDLEKLRPLSFDDFAGQSDIREP